MSLFSKETLESAGVSTKEHVHQELIDARAKNAEFADTQRQHTIASMEDSSTEHSIISPENARIARQEGYAKATAEHEAITVSAGSVGKTAVGSETLTSHQPEVHAEPYVEQQPAGVHSVVDPNQPK